MIRIVIWRQTSGLFCNDGKNDLSNRFPSTEIVCDYMNYNVAIEVINIIIIINN